MKSSPFIYSFIDHTFGINLKSLPDQFLQKLSSVFFPKFYMLMSMVYFEIQFEYKLWIKVHFFPFFLHIENSVFPASLFDDTIY